MGEKDLTTKKLEDFEDVFADILNVLLFHKDYIKPEQLRDGPTESIYKAGSKKNRNQFRDTFKNYEETGIAIAGFGFENEAKPEKPMAARIFCYDAGSYMRQLKKKQSSNSRARSGTLRISSHTGAGKANGTSRSMRKSSIWKNFWN